MNLHYNLFHLLSNFKRRTESNNNLVFYHGDRQIYFVFCLKRGKKSLTLGETLLLAHAFKVKNYFYIDKYIVKVYVNKITKSLVLVHTRLTQISLLC